jgi:hypothetical protein
MVITTPMIVYRHGDDVPGERIREILVYEGCISQPDRNVENPDNSDLLACIAQKSLEICERCRLWQRNSPATPENSAAFWREEFKNSLFRFIRFETGSWTGVERVFKSLLARNKLAASASA